jgi:2-polyprenyl-6-methoxyphenol hydroxylase-like FAD-dependent oxidoreductase
VHVSGADDPAIAGADLVIAADGARGRMRNRLLGMAGPGARLRDAVFRMVPTAMGTRAIAAQFRFEPVPQSTLER